jgi:hypothetical protein
MRPPAAKQRRTDMDRFTGRRIGRFAIMDGVARRVINDEARKTRVATFPGEHYSSEFENGQLHVYAHTDEQGNPARKFGDVEGTSGIRSSAGSRLDTVGPVRSIAELNQMHAKHFAGIGVRRRA